MKFDYREHDDKTRKRIHALCRGFKCARESAPGRGGACPRAGKKQSQNRRR